MISISFTIWYVYVLTRAYFTKSQNLIELGQNLGFQEKIFLFYNSTICKTSIVAGLSLVAMETLSDFGAVSFFGISTLTT